MRRLLEDSPVKGYQLYRWEKRKPDGTAVVLPKYYIRHGGKDTCTGIDRLRDAKVAVKKLAGEEAQERSRRTARPDEVTIGTLLDLVIEDYRANGQKTLKHAKGQIEHGLRPYFGEKLAGTVNTADIEKWIEWRESRRLRKSTHNGKEKLQPASINRELCLLRRGYQLGYERNPQLVEKIPPIKKLAENNVRKGFVSPEQYKALWPNCPSISGRSHALPSTSLTGKANC
jgi:hypothetical protein